MFDNKNYELCWWLAGGMTSPAPAAGLPISVTEVLQDILAGVEWSLVLARQLRQDAVCIFTTVIHFNYNLQPTGVFTP